MIRFSDMLGRVAESGRGLWRAEDATLIERAQAILEQDGEAVLVARARDFLDRYLALGRPDREAFLKEAAAVSGPARGPLREAVERWLDGEADVDARALHFASEPKAQELIRRLNRAEGGTRDLVAMREDLLRITDDPLCHSLDQDFRHLFASWFNRGFLELRRIDWDTPASILEKIIRYEAVHEIGDWRDLRGRVAAPDRQLYAFFHPALPGEPLIFVEVALTREVPGAIAPVLADDREPLDPSRATTAVFYSISNCQRGLRGVSFGNFLIKQVVEELSRDHPGLARFVTLSPVPGLSAWLDAEGLSPDEDRLPGLAARYLLEAKRADGRPLDPVARFHLGNGARLDRINTDADHSARGRAQSYGVMVNYLYDAGQIERQHEAFAKTGEVATSPAVRRLVKRGAEADA